VTSSSFLRRSGGIALAIRVPAMVKRAFDEVARHPPTVRRRPRYTYLSDSGTIFGGGRLYSPKHPRPVRLEFVGDVANSAADEVLAGEPVGAADAPRTRFRMSPGFVEFAARVFGAT
jgi:hypothetical protein